MSWLAEKCVRCGKKTRAHSDAGLPTCEDCQTDLKAERESPRSCPVDGSHMNKQTVHNVVIDRCPTCGGIWLDAGELELVKDALTAGDKADLATGMLLGMFN